MRIRRCRKRLRRRRWRWRSGRFTFNQQFRFPLIAYSFRALFGTGRWGLAMKRGLKAEGFCPRGSAAIALGFSGLVLTQVVARADPSALWNIVHGQCVAHIEGGEGPGPCISVDLAGGEKAG